MSIEGCRQRSGCMDSEQADLRPNSSDRIPEEVLIRKYVNLKPRTIPEMKFSIPLKKLFQDRNKISLLDSVDQDQTAPKVQSDLDVHCPQ